MEYHVLNGDALYERFMATGLPGEVVVARECLVEGDLSGDTLPEFYKTRAAYLSAGYNEKEEYYFSNVVKQFDIIQQASDGAEINLWFGYDLFCRANMWFIISLLYRSPQKKKIYVVYPSYLPAENAWDDFGGAATGDLLTCYRDRILFNEQEIMLGNSLWTAFKENNLAALEKLSQQPTTGFPYLHEVCTAHIERFPANNQKGRPEQVIAGIIEEKGADFPAVFREFYKKEAIYGFGDLQVKHLYDKVLLAR